MEINQKVILLGSGESGYYLGNVKYDWLPCKDRINNIKL